MAVPENIRKAWRPTNTIIIDNKTGNNYAVRERLGVKYVPNGFPQPINGKVIGHMVNGKFVGINDKTADKGPDMLSYGSSALIKSVSDDIYEDLLKTYPNNDAASIMAIASLKVIYPSTSNSRISTHYKLSYISKYYPNAAVSINSICNLYENIGMDGNKRKEFFTKRFERVLQEHHIIIDGMLVQNTSKINDLSAFSRKARVKGCKDISILYAYDIETMDIICAEVFPGNSIDSKSYPSFIKDNNITRGIIINDKGFPPSVIQKELEERPNLHFLTPLKRTDKRIKDNDMLKFEGVLSGIDKKVLYSKKKIKGGHYLYCFKDIKKASEEENGYITKAKNNKSFDLNEYEKKKELFGVIVFESDVDMPPLTAYLSYEDRWTLELVFDRYKNDECLDKTSVQNDFSVIGSSFVNTISTMLTCRILKKAESVNLLDDMTYKELMDDLSSSWRMVDSPSEAKRDDGCFVHTLDYVFDELEKLGLSLPMPKSTPKKKGRPKKNKEVDKPKRPRGRPRKSTTVLNV